MTSGGVLQCPRPYRSSERWLNCGPPAREAGYGGSPGGTGCARRRDVTLRALDELVELAAIEPDAAAVA